MMQIRQRSANEKDYIKEITATFIGFEIDWRMFFPLLQLATNNIGILTCLKMTCITIHRNTNTRCLGFFSYGYVD